MNTEKNKKIILIAIITGFMSCLVFEYAIYKLNLAYNFFKPLSYTYQSQIERHEGGGILTNPILECFGAEYDGIREYNISDVELQKEVNKEIQKHGLITMSVYVRDLNNGPWMGINQDDDFIGGSLLKVPMLISYLKLSESDPTILSRKIDYPKQIVSNVQYYSPSIQIEPGKTYTIEELLNYMIVYSDNNAAELLLKNIDRKEFDKVFVALGMGDPDPNRPYTVDTKKYAAFFRVLFNASYLNKANSEKALDILTKVEFNRGIQAQIPNNLVVAHKFGLRTDGQVNQLHDCGIVYYPDHPYLLCIMSRGGTFDAMSSSIANISKFIYEKFNSHK